MAIVVVCMSVSCWIICKRPNTVMWLCTSLLKWPGWAFKFSKVTSRNSTSINLQTQNGDTIQYAYIQFNLIQFNLFILTPCKIWLQHIVV